MHLRGSSTSLVRACSCDRDFLSHDCDAQSSTLSVACDFPRRPVGARLRYKTTCSVTDNECGHAAQEHVPSKRNFSKHPQIEVYSESHDHTYHCAAFGCLSREDAKKKHTKQGSVGDRCD